MTADENKNDTIAILITNRINYRNFKKQYMQNYAKVWLSSRFDEFTATLKIRRSLERL